MASTAFPDPHPRPTRWEGEPPTITVTFVWNEDSEYPYADRYGRLWEPTDIAIEPGCPEDLLSALANTLLAAGARIAAPHALCLRPSRDVDDSPFAFVEPDPD